MFHVVSLLLFINKSLYRSTKTVWIVFDLTVTEIKLRSSENRTGPFHIAHDHFISACTDTVTAKISSHMMTANKIVS